MCVSVVSIPPVMCYGYRSLIEPLNATSRPSSTLLLRPSAARWSSGFRIESAGGPLRRGRGPSKERKKENRQPIESLPQRRAVSFSSYLTLSSPPECRGTTQGEHRAACLSRPRYPVIHTRARPPHLAVLTPRTWFKVTSLNTKSPARSRALRDVSTHAEEYGTAPYDLSRALFSLYPYRMKHLLGYHVSSSKERRGSASG